MFLCGCSLLATPAPTGVFLAFRDPFPFSRLLLAPGPSSVSEWDRESASVERLLRLLDLVLVDEARLPVTRNLKSKKDSLPKVFGRFSSPSDFPLEPSAVLGRRLQEPETELAVNSPFPGESGGASKG